jgi:hypothetical protein
LENVRTAREAINTLGCYGTVTIAHFNGKHLPHIAELANLVVIDETDSMPNDKEIKRILAPKGVALIRSDDGWKRIVKPWPNDIDEWTHYLYDPSNNAVAKDERIAPRGECDGRPDLCGLVITIGWPPLVLLYRLADDFFTSWMKDHSTRRCCLLSGDLWHEMRSTVHCYGSVTFPIGLIVLIPLRAGQLAYLAGS